MGAATRVHQLLVTRAVNSGRLFLSISFQVLSGGIKEKKENAAISIAQNVKLLKTVSHVKYRCHELAKNQLSVSSCNNELFCMPEILEVIPLWKLSMLLRLWSPTLPGLLLHPFEARWDRPCHSFRMLLEGSFHKWRIVEMRFLVPVSKMLLCAASEPVTCFCGGLVVSFQLQGSILLSLWHEMKIQLWSYRPAGKTFKRPVPKGKGTVGICECSLYLRNVKMPKTRSFLIKLDFPNACCRNLASVFPWSDDKHRRGLVLTPAAPGLAVPCLILLTNEEELTTKSERLLLLQFCLSSYLYQSCPK